MAKIEPLKKPAPKKKAAASGLPRGKHAATKPNTEKSRKAALTEIEERIEQLSDVDVDVPTPATATLARVANGGEGGMDGQVVAHNATRANVGQPAAPAKRAAAVGRGKKKTEREVRADDELVKAAIPDVAVNPVVNIVAKPKRMSILDAAALVLSESDRPLRAKEIIDIIIERGLWTSPGGKTPEATLYAAMIREITARADDARFRKVERGLFTHASSPIAAQKTANKKGA